MARKAAKRNPRPKPKGKTTSSGAKRRITTASARKSPKTKSRPSVAKPPAPPKWLSAIAKAEWKRLAPALTKLGKLTDLDLSSFEGYCESYALWRNAQEWLNKPTHQPTIVLRDKDGKVKQLAAVPHVTIARNALADMQRLGALFGLSPADRRGAAPSRQPNYTKRPPAAADNSDQERSKAADALAAMRADVGIEIVN